MHLFYLLLISNIYVQTNTICNDTSYLNFPIRIYVPKVITYANKQTVLLPREAAMLARFWRSKFCPSVCPSITRVLCDETKEHIANILKTHEREITLVF